MSYYATFKAYTDVLDYLKTVDYPQCFTVNYKPDTEEYALWIGNQPYYVYEEWIEEEEKELNDVKGQKDFWLRNYSLSVSEHNKEVESIRGQLSFINNQLLKLIKE